MRPTGSWRLTDTAAAVTGNEEEIDTLDAFLGEPNLEEDFDDGDSGSEDSAFQAIFLLITPDTLPEQVTITFSERDTVPDVLTAVADNMDEARYLLYPHLVPAFPQPDRYWGTLFALPAWLTNESIACFDSRQVDGRFFAIMVPQVATKTQLCQIAGFINPDDVHAFPYGQMIPMGPDSEATFTPGGSVIFARRHFLPRAGLTLEHMLARPYDWDDNPDLPFGPTGHHYCCVREGGHFLVTLDRERRESVKDAASRTLAQDPQQFFVQAASPLVTDAAIRGFHCLDTHAVVMLEAFPGAQPRVATIVDCRPLLQGWSIYLTDSNQVSHSSLIQELDVFTPAGWQVQLDPIDVTDGYFPTFPGRIVVATYVPLTTDEELSPRQPWEGFQLGLSSGSDNPSSHADFSYDPIDEPSPKDHAVSPRSRSRSPHDSTGLQFLGDLWDRLVPPWHIPDCFCFRKLQEPTVCKVLVEPSAQSVSARSRLDALRAHAHSLGIAWPYLRSDDLSFSSRAGPGILLETAVADPVSLHFAVLVPDYVPEIVRKETHIWPHFSPFYFRPCLNLGLAGDCCWRFRIGADYHVYTGFEGEPRDLNQRIATFFLWIQCGLGFFAETLRENVRSRPKHSRALDKTLQHPFGGKLMSICAFLIAWIPTKGTPLGHLNHPITEDFELGLPAAATFAPRPVPTPLRNLLLEGDRHGSHQQEKTSKDNELLHEVFALGLPRTLLQEAYEQPGCEAMFLARTLLETLVEHFGGFGARAVTRSRRSVHVRQAPITLSLTDSLEITPYQRQCLALHTILPHGEHCGTLPAADWLDTDIRHVLANKRIDIRLRAAFVNFKNWHEHADLQPHRVLVYTDGSASSSPDDLRPASWGFAVFVRSSGRDYFYGQAAAVAMPPSSPLRIGEQQDDALTGELLALCWGLSWIAEFGPHFRVPVELLYDSQCAGGGTFGISSPVTGKVDRPYERLANLAISLRHYASALVTLEHDYIPSHSGALGNELADALAKTARSLSKHWDDWLLPPWLPLFAKHSLRDWAWAFVQGQVDVPRPYAFEAEASLARQLPLGPIPAPPARLQTKELPAAEASFDITFVSFNALTLKEPDKKGKRPAEVGMRILGRKAVLQGSLERFHPHVIGLQETRLDNSEFQRDPEFFICNAESDDMGVGGCSLWFSRRRPYGVCAGQPLLFQESDITVVSLSHRHLTVNLLAPRLRLHIQVIHALSVPTSGVEAVRAFWSARADEIQHRPAGTDYVLLCDANSRVGGIVSLHIGSHHGDPENEAGSLYHEFLSQIDAFLPATFSEHHTGPSSTWCSPTGNWSRIDYIAVPRSWDGFALETRVLQEVETMQKRDDHVPTLLRGRFVRWALSALGFAKPRTAVRPPTPHTRHERLQARQLLEQVPAQSWFLDVNVHHQRLTTAWDRAVQQTAVPLDPEPRQPFVTQDTLSVIHLRAALRVYLRQEKTELRRRYLIVCFAAFVHLAQGTVFASSAVGVADSWFRQMDASEAAAISALHLSCRTIRRKVAADRLAYLDRLVGQAAQYDTRDPAALYKAVRRAFPDARSSRRSALKPLPALQMEDGTCAHSLEDRNEIWRKHFAHQEAGCKVSPEDYCAHLQNQRRASMWSFDIRAVPTLRQVESVIHSLKHHKAVGADLVSAELLRFDVPVSSRQLFPVLAKASIRAFEPVAFRGGELFLLAKRAAKTLGCSGFRSILLTSVAGKVYHRCVRQTLLPAFQDVRHSFHASLIRGQGIDTISLAAKTFFALGNTQGSSAGIVFFDLSAAFYSVIRQTLVDTRDSDEGLLRLFRHLDIPPEAISELAMHLQKISLLEAAGVSEHSREIVADLFQGTYFRLTTGGALTLTGRGTRPGDPMADLLFAFTLSSYMQSALGALRDQHLLADVPTTSQRPQGIDWQSSVELHCPAWADDFFFTQSGATFPDLVDRVRRSAGLLTSHASSLGMAVKFGQEKTAVLLPAELLVRHADLLDRNEDHDLGITLQDTVAQTRPFLPAVRAYRHLGGVITADSNPSPDLNLRFAHSMGIVKPLRKKLFGARRFELPVRRNLLRSLAVSRYTHTAAALVLHASIHRRLWERQYMAVWRVLVARTAVDNQAHNFEVLRQAQAPSPALALALSRATCLAKLYTVGPHALLALLWDHWVLHKRSSWLAQLEEDAMCVAVFRPQALASFEGTEKVRGIVESLAQDSSWWVRQVKAAIKDFLEDLDVWKQQQKGPRPAPDRLADSSMTTDCVAEASEDSELDLLSSLSRPKAYG
ncbi:hypothetical protein AK812_SmicGene18181 [Symbiodinium microadriaticum]|uniref:RNase H type-1 domain-containing protein n=1 Tax=Symbiodinium microadriaticum TaxID=2951 RepID=A0A1Q9DVT6_SYMMI|nr:hypothetical protein AK812_SmicGene18181 [Symbiodinium microadriaticum]